LLSAARACRCVNIFWITRCVIQNVRIGESAVTSTGMAALNAPAPLVLYFRLHSTKVNIPAIGDVFGRATGLYSDSQQSNNRTKQTIIL
jgi:hypothetical protein